MFSLASLISLAALLDLLYGLYTTFKHARNFVRWRCGSLPAYPSDFLGWNTLKELQAADKARRLPVLFVDRFSLMETRENRRVNTYLTRQALRDVIITCDPKNVQAMLATQFQDFELGSARRISLHPLLGNGIFTTDGEHCDLNLEERHVQHAFRAMPVDPTTGWTSAVDIQTLFFRLTMDSATEFLFGESVNSQSAALDTNQPDSFSANFDRGQQFAGQRARLDKLHWLANTKESRHVTAEVHAYQQSRKPDISSPAPTKQHGVFLQQLAAATQDPIELRSQLLNVLLAGRDTTASLLSWSLLLLARHSDLHCPITFTSLKDCRYLQAFLNEVLRLYPIVPNNRRTAVRDTTLPRGGGPDGSRPVYIRAGQQVLYSVFAMHRRVDLWGEDANEFRPERWEYLPFNGGPRICIGQQFALTEAGYVLVRLLQRFGAVEDVFSEREISYALNLTIAPGENVTVRMKAA
ncbi:putative cytochrome P450 family protein [Aspergillus campestris IBT 28561]|uniref:Cytochrome P450 family protein n=1 Tax=Aspergillus campestris (strain IBT 28561) TaxID=1392248 RepID=A0A2I1CQ03_ASPC2|nr:putative cytochrome P450 family protein [Aspergillus campestris IBT 28561]PKX99701.1 putative cytochrome P450 family protein [Aspergillus campestris IBT 28561]